MLDTGKLKNMKSRSYSELIHIPSFLERYRYLRIGGKVGIETFGRDRYINQILYHSTDWRRFRERVIVRDYGRDLALEGFDIVDSKILIHHLNPITADDIINRNPCVFDLDNVVSTSFNTHQAIHYGDENLLIALPPERKPNDTCLWINKK